MNYWKTKDGREISISEMDIDHIKNTSFLLEKKIIGLAHQCSPDGLEICYDCIFNRPLKIKYDNWIKEFKSELENRNY